MYLVCGEIHPGMKGKLCSKAVSENQHISSCLRTGTLKNKTIEKTFKFRTFKSHQVEKTTQLQ